MSEGFTKSERLLRRSDFVSIYENGEKRHFRFVVMFARPNTLAHPRLGITVTRKFGKSHDRNKVRRRIREIFRRSKGAIGLDPIGVDMVLNVKGNAKDAPFADFEREMIRAFRGAIPK